MKNSRFFSFIKSIWYEIDFKGIAQNCGVFVLIPYATLVIVLSVLLLPLLPFYFLNQWSKTWFH